MTPQQISNCSGARRYEKRFARISKTDRSTDRSVKTNAPGPGEQQLLDSGGRREDQAENGPGTTFQILLTVAAPSLPASLPGIGSPQQQQFLT
jgi:hypothetical protein